VAPGVGVIGDVAGQFHDDLPCHCRG
jgi:hypothetical protein